MKDKKFYQIERRIADGRLHYIIFYGVLGWGLPTGVLGQAIIQYFSGSRSIQTPESIFAGILTFTIMGILYGYIMWRVILHQYNHEKAERQRENNENQ